MNRLYFGDNLTILREYIADGSVDLIYLDPPFNSNASYNLLYRTNKGHRSDAQIEAFDDTWHWGEQAEREHGALLHQPNTEVAELMRALRSFLGENDLMAYLVMMASRLLELHRVLRPTGSLYLHCDPTASHYLKVVLDGVFGKENFRNEIVWKRSHAHNSAKRYGPNHDIIFFYSRTERYAWNAVYHVYDNDYIEKHYQHEDEKGRRYKHENPTGAGVRHGETGKPWRGIDPSAKGRHWARPPDVMEELARQGKIHFPERTGAWPYLKVYLDEMSGIPLQDLWTDMPPINMRAAERLGYPTQKPLALLKRIVQASSNPGDLVLDPFCGCGTAVHAAQALGRRWIGIDITHLAIGLIEHRLKTAFPDIRYEVHGTPKDMEGARDLAARDKYQFQWWACSLVNAQPAQGKKKGADSGLDGVLFFQDGKGPAQKIVVSVKGGGNITVAMVRDLAHVIDREKAAIGLFVTLTEPTAPMRKEAAALGFYASPNFPGQDYPRLQILTIGGLLAGQERARYPDLSGGSATFKKAAQHINGPKQGELF